MKIHSITATDPRQKPSIASSNNGTDRGLDREKTKPSGLSDKGKFLMTVEETSTKLSRYEHPPLSVIQIQRKPGVTPQPYPASTSGETDDVVTNKTLVPRSSDTQSSPDRNGEWYGLITETKAITNGGTDECNQPTINGGISGGTDECNQPAKASHTGGTDECNQPVEIGQSQSDVPGARFDVVRPGRTNRPNQPAGIRVWPPKLRTLI
jgi:hypothetical protein